MLRIYNAVNHDVVFYTVGKTAENRKNQIFLINPTDYPDKIVKRGKPMSIKSCVRSVGTQDMPRIFLPESMSGSSLDILPGFFDYDIIIVSSMYANLAMQLIRNLDYLDRLYVPVPAYNVDPSVVSKSEVKKVGSCGLKKVCPPKSPYEYAMDINNGCSPSIQSLRVCCDIYQNDIIYFDDMTRGYLETINRFLYQRFNLM